MIFSEIGGVEVQCSVGRMGELPAATVLPGGGRQCPNGETGGLFVESTFW